jgi:hypothetical protein
LVACPEGQAVALEPSKTVLDVLFTNVLFNCHFFELGIAALNSELATRGLVGLQVFDQAVDDVELAS